MFGLSEIVCLLASAFDPLFHFHNPRMKCVYKDILCLSLLYSVQLGITATISVSLPPIETEPPQLFHTSYAGQLNLTYRPLQLSIDHIGVEIPEEEVINTLRDADGAIRNEVSAHPNQRIYNGRFEYRCEHGDMLFLISALSGEEITWSELQRIISAVYRYMTGGEGHPEEHYNTLEFRILFLSHQVVGFGLVWYHPSETSIQRRSSPWSITTIGNSRRIRRVALPPTLLTMSEHQVLDTRQGSLDHLLTVSKSPKLETQTPSSTVAERNNPIIHTHIPIPLSGKPLILIVTSLGSPIPEFEVGAALTSALRQIQPAVKEHAQAPTTNDHYWYRDQVSNLWFITIASSYKVITWEQLSWTMAGLLRWMQGDNSREISFELEMNGEGYIGSGNLGYDPPRISQTAHREIQNR